MPDLHPILLDTLSDATASFDTEHCLRQVSTAFTRLLGYGSKDLGALRFSDFVHHRHHRELGQHLDALSTPSAPSLPRSLELTCLARDGRETDLECRLELVSQAEGAHTYRAVFVDPVTVEITQRVQRQFISLMHHELKTPLTSIVASARLLDADTDKAARPDHARLLDILNRNTSRLERLIENLLDLQRLAYGEISYRLEPVELGSALSEASQHRSPQQPHLRYRLELEPLPEHWVLTDRKRLIQVLEEMLENAPRFAWKGRFVRIGLALGQGATRIELTGERLKRPASSLVEEPPPRPIGEPIEDPTASEVAPAGIGLTLAQEVLAGMQAKLEVDDRAAGGARVTIHLPNASQAPSDPETGSS
ncbi:MAG: PAS domain-containing sensor histidine kinase [Acidobacteriota bacterium]